ncbi:MAG: hypothetical protein GY822_16915 [Deltaproteobacteria bacterium]|nr:hypothetical protein [Deltaproteobacteria bacterium]
MSSSLFVQSSRLFIAALSVVGLSACFGPAGPYATGLTVQTETDVVATTRIYRVVAGGSPKESKRRSRHCRNL